MDGSDVYAVVYLQCIYNNEVVYKYECYNDEDIADYNCDNDYKLIKIDYVKKYTMVT